MNLLQILALTCSIVAILANVAAIIIIKRSERARREFQPISVIMDPADIRVKFKNKDEELGKLKNRNDMAIARLEKRLGQLNEKSTQMFGLQYYQLKDYQKKEVGLAVSKSQDYLALSSDIPGHQNQSGPSLA